MIKYQIDTKNGNRYIAETDKQKFWRTIFCFFSSLGYIALLRNKRYRINQRISQTLHTNHKNTY